LPVDIPTGLLFITAHVMAHGHELLHADADYHPLKAHLGLHIIVRCVTGEADR
jgi:hypothetical protein